ncbi:MAG: A/G-specific adenine glycosylase [SAR324 cluster bacterium]|nr:A/G-specific adenine glycosylase [SAR324 cluster bacterium]
MVSARQLRKGLPPQRGKDGALRKALLKWFAEARRPLPWRERYDPYQVWISEIMLQQTQVETVLPYFARWMAAFPDVAAVAGAPQEVLLKAWEGLGYYSRARNLGRAARRIVTDHGGVLPASPEVLRSLPGIGPYTAGAIASIGFNVSTPAVDGNVSRVLGLLLALPDPVNTPRGRARVWEIAARLVPVRNARAFNEGLMELGALVCRARAPACDACPLANHCAAHARGTPEAFPRKQPRARRRRLRGVLLLLGRGKQVLLRKRPGEGLWGGMWEIPWLERRRGEGCAAALTRLLDGLELPLCAPPRKLGVVDHGLTHIQMRLDCYRAEIKEEQSSTWASTPSGQPLRWAAPGTLRKLPLARLSHKAIALGWEPAHQRTDPGGGAPRRTDPGGGPAPRPVGKRGKMV